MASFSGGYSETQHDGYTELVVDSNDRVEIELFDSDTVENYLINIGNSGARYRIYANGAGWTIRNIGVTGFLEGTGSSEEPFIIASTGGVNTVENVAIDIDTPISSNPSSHTGETGIYFMRDSSGEVNINNLYVQNCRDNGVYASSPGFNDGGQATVTISNSKAVNCNTSGFRLGTDGSALENCVIDGGEHRGYWAFTNTTDIVDCDIESNGSDIALGDSAYAQTDDATVNASNSRWNSVTTHGGASTSNLNGSSQGSPDGSRVPSGCPTSAVEAASGSSGSEPEPDPEPENHISESFSHRDIASNYNGDTDMFQITEFNQ